MNRKKVLDKVRIRVIYNQLGTINRGNEVKRGET